LTPRGVRSVGSSEQRAASWLRQTRAPAGAFFLGQQIELEFGAGHADTGGIPILGGDTYGPYYCSPYANRYPDVETSLAPLPLLWQHHVGGLP
jgi:hypothetical protein